MESGKYPRTALEIVDPLLDLVQVQSSQTEVIIAVAQVLVVEDGLRDGVGASSHVFVEVFPIEGEQFLLHVVDGAVRSVVGQSALLLQLLPDGPDLVHEGVVHEEDGVVGGVLQRGHGVLLSSANQVVHGVVGHLELNLNQNIAECLQLLLAISLMVEMDGGNRCVIGSQYLQSL